MSSIRSIIRHAASAALLAAAAVAGPAQAVSIDVGSYTKTRHRRRVRDQLRHLHDHRRQVHRSRCRRRPSRSRSARSGSRSGPNCYSCTLTPSFDAILDVKVRGETQQLHIPYAWYSVGSERLPDLLAGRRR